MKGKVGQTVPFFIDRIGGGIVRIITGKIVEIDAPHRTIVIETEGSGQNIITTFESQEEAQALFEKAKCGFH